MKMKSVFFLMMLFMASIAQSQGERPMLTMKGQVIDVVSRKPVEFATISVMKTEDSTLVTGGISDMNGAFEIPEVPAMKYYLKISFIGFEDLIVPPVRPNKSTMVCSFDSLAMSIKEGSLAEVDIHGEKRIMEVSIDKKVFNVDKQMASSGGTGLDVLRELPSVEVDENDEITLRGESNVTILVDGRPSAIPASSLLRSMPASNIEKIEIITNPSAKYDPEGMTGILNVILKKNKQRGINGSVSASVGYGEYLKTNASLSLNYRNKIMNIYATYAGDWSEYGGGSTQERFTDSEILRVDGHNIRGNNSHNLKYGMDFFLNKNHTIYFSGALANTGYSYGRGRSNYHTSDGEDSLLTYSYRNTNTPNRKNYGLGLEFNLGYQAKFKKPGHTFDWDMNYSGQNATDKTFAELYLYDGLLTTELAEPLDQLTINGAKNHTFYSRMDYLYPFNDSMKIEAGFHATIKQRNDSYYVESDSTDTEVFEPNTDINNDFNYNQQVYAAYVTWGHQVGKFGYKLGLRAEQTLTSSVLVTTDDNFKNNYFGLFPTAHFSYNMTKTQSLTLGYSRRINRPRNRQLNPFADLTNPYSIHKGNPFLKPEFVHVVELGYTAFLKKWMVNASVYYRYLDDIIRRQLTIEGNVAVVEFANIANGQRVGAELMVRYKPFKWWTLMGSGNFNYSTTDTTGYDPSLNFTSLGFRYNVSSKFDIKYGISIQVSARGRTAKRVLQGTIQPAWGLDFAISKTLFKGKGSISFRASDLFNTRQFAFESLPLNGLDYTTTHKWESRAFYVSFRYSFGKDTKERRSRERNGSGDNNSEQGM
jgi:outer membrane receptor protein involved in Fe transport